MLHSKSVGPAPDLLPSSLFRTSFIFTSVLGILSGPRAKKLLIWEATRCGVNTVVIMCLMAPRSVPGGPGWSGVGA